METVLCLGLVLLVIAAAAPLVAGLRQALELSMEAQTLASQLYRARSWAITEQVTVELELAPDRSAYRLHLPSEPLTDAPWRRLPSSVHLVEIPPAPVRFYALGHASPGGTYRLQSGRLRSSIIVSLTGRTRIQYDND